MSVCVFKSVCLYVCMYVCMYVFMHACVCLYVGMLIRISIVVPRAQQCAVDAIVVYSGHQDWVLVCPPGRIRLSLRLGVRIQCHSYVPPALKLDVSSEIVFLSMDVLISCPPYVVLTHTSHSRPA